MATEEDVYVLAQSNARIDKERDMRAKRLRRYVERLKAIQGQSLTRDQLLMKRVESSLSQLSAAAIRPGAPSASVPRRRPDPAA
jgi:hypothetical protein